MGIYKFGNNTYSRRIRRRSNLGHIFRGEKKYVLWAGKYGNSVRLALVVDCSWSGFLELSFVFIFVRTRPQTPLCNVCHAIVLRVSVPEESSSGSSYKNFKNTPVIHVFALYFIVMGVWGSVVVKALRY